MTAGIGLNLLAFAVLVGYLAWRAYPLTAAIRLRNALLLQESRPSDFAWAPPDFPMGFKAERLPASAEFRAIVRALGVDAMRADWDRGLTLARHLTENAAEKGGPLQADLAKTYRGIRDGYGYCADFVKVYLALAHAAGITARQWAFSFDGFGGHGHTFVEIFDRQRQRWLCLDVHNNFHFVDSATREPLDALGALQRLSGNAEAPVLEPNGNGRLAFRYPEKALDYYRRGRTEWYLWWGNAVYSYDEHPAVAFAMRLSRRLAHFVGNLVGVQPRIHILCTDENRPAVAAMFALRRRLRIILAGIALLLVTLLVQLARAFAYGQ